MSTLTICGLAAKAVPAGFKYGKNSERGRTRYIVDGMNRKDGTPIKYKSIDRAERDILNYKRSIDR